MHCGGCFALCCLRVGVAFLLRLTEPFEIGRVFDVPHVPSFAVAAVLIFVHIESLGFSAGTGSAGLPVAMSRSWL